MHISLYIGHHKVGSTSLQVYLSQNFNKLLDAGILYPFTEMTGAAAALARSRRGDTAEVLPVNIREPHSALAYRMMAEVSDRKVPQQFQMLPSSHQMMHAIRAQVEALQPTGLILCSEAFTNFGSVEPQLVRRLCDQFPKATFSLYCALRRPDDYMVSWHGQRIKVSEPVSPLREGAWAHYAPTIHLNFRLAVEAWLDLVPGQHKVLRNYGDILKAGGSEADYIAHSGLAFPKDMLPAVSANKSLPLAVTEIARRGNAVLSTPDAHRLIRFLQAVDGKITLPHNADVEMFGAAHRKNIFNEFLPIHDWLSRAAGAEAFFPDLNQILECRTMPETEAVRAALDQLTPEVTAPLPVSVRDFIAQERARFAPLQP
ncbi:hypothetical protein [Phaeovulum sp.]|uniref:hypothetical protein n=1 Tax=Phaeovulum sp. TaxID=2934796 RepID=UPI0035669629